ncbi:MAG TPA: hypothetical protein ENJ00_03450 [Phycisphaerales bacterium]|nr:hypothetical protein [Phycisphaerales bacterium]
MRDCIRTNPVPTARPCASGGGLSLLAMVAVLVAASSGLSTVRLLGQASIGLALTVFPESVRHDAKPAGFYSGDRDRGGRRDGRSTPAFATADAADAVRRLVLTRSGLVDLPPPTI